MAFRSQSARTFPMHLRPRCPGNEPCSPTWCGREATEPHVSSSFASRACRETPISMAQPSARSGCAAPTRSEMCSLSPCWRSICVVCPSCLPHRAPWRGWDEEDRCTRSGQSDVHCYAPLAPARLRRSMLRDQLSVRSLRSFRRGLPKGRASHKLLL